MLISYCLGRRSGWDPYGSSVKFPIPKVGVGVGFYQNNNCVYKFKYSYLDLCCI